MKFLFALLLLPTFAHAEDLTIFKCEYRIVSRDKPAHVMVGNIIAEDAQNQGQYGVTYLTLAPNQLSGDTLEARILITSDGYNPITLHKPGNSASTVASTILKGDSADLTYTDEKSVTHSVSCKRR